MKIAHYNQMMAYLTRRRFSNGGSTIIPKAKPFTANMFKDKADLYIQGVHGGFGKELMLPKLQSILEKVVKDNSMTKAEALTFIQERNNFYKNFAEENPGGTLPRWEKADGGRIKAADGIAVKTLNPLFPDKNIDPMSDEYRPLDFPGAVIPPLAIGAGAKRIKDIFFNKPKDESKEEIVERIEKVEKDKKEDPMKEPPDPYKDFETLSKVLDQYRKFDEKRKEKNKKKPPTRFIDGEGNVTFSTRGPRLDPAPDEAFQIDKEDQQNAVIFANRLLSKKRSPGDRKELALFREKPNLKKFKNKVDNLYSFRKNPKLLEKQISGLKKAGVNFDEFYNPGEIAALLGLPTASGVTDALRTGNIPFKKIGPFKGVKLNDYVNYITKQTERLSNVKPMDVRTLARSNFLSEVGGSIYNKFKDMRAPKYLPKDVKEVYEKYNLGEIEGGHPFPIEFFTKKYGKGNTLQDERQFDWIHRNKDKLFDKNDLVFQSKDVNKLYRNKISELKKLYKELGPLVDKYEGKGPVTNEKDINKIANLNLKIMKIATDSEGDAKKFIEKSPNSRDLPRMSKGGLHGAIFDYETGEVSLYALEKKQVL